MNNSADLRPQLWVFSRDASMLFWKTTFPPQFFFGNCLGRWVSHLPSSKTKDANLKLKGFYLNFLHGSEWPEVRCKWQGRFVLPLFHLQYGLPLLLSRDALWGKPPCQGSCAGMGTQWLWWGELLMDIWYTMSLEVGTNLPHQVCCTSSNL